MIMAMTSGALRSAVCCTCAFVVFSVAPAAAQNADTLVAPGVHLLRGSFVSGRQPDGNSIVLEGKDGLIVVDSGRHREHTQRILDFATAVAKPIVAVVNTHWHLDHIGGNPLLRAAHSQLSVHASSAVEGAMSGFLAKYRRTLETQLAKPELAQDKRATLTAERDLIDAGPALYPDVPVVADVAQDLAGRRVQLRLEADAVTGGDVWLLDGETRVLISGDLVTLPAPLFDTACAARWQRSLARIAAADFDTLIPGHGEPMSRAAFGTWRSGFDGLLACAESSSPSSDCIDGWLKTLGALVPKSDHEQARSLLQYYLDARLRGDPAKVGAYCP
jgi:glyoxylase-like metal-dependent hydrolase (beta-lactamase superfamily II)